jgi:UDP-hydrolysing UDP-N-acetyl-D-glucosamine 2-epimerase
MKKYNYKKRKICIVTTNRADYGHLRDLIFKVHKSKNLMLKLVVSGSHLSKKHGYSISEILKDKLPITSKIRLSVKKDFDNRKIIKSLSESLIKFDSVINRINPDIILILGDRYEILPIAQVALFRNIPLAHLHGGEVTSGVLDEQIRHAVTKFSDIHFVSNKIFAKNILSLGENKKNIFIVGSPGCENLNNKKYLTKKNIEKILGLKFFEKNIVVTIHPQTNRNSTKKLIKNSLYALKKLKDTLVIFTSVNPDLNSDLIAKNISKFKNYDNFKFYKNLGQNLYLSLIKQVDCIVGNSSSGFIEAPFLKIPVVNIGNRQDGRPLVSNIVQTNLEKKNILRAIKKIYNPDFRRKLKHTRTFYYKKNTTENIIKVLRNINLINIKIKKFKYEKP